MSGSTRRCRPRDIFLTMGIPAPATELRRREALGLAGLAALTALCVYVATLAPGLTGEDSGEFISAAYTLGIPHPPGYPLYCLVAHAFTHLPLGAVAWRVNLMSAVFAALTVGVLTYLAGRLTGRRLAAMAAGLVFAFSRELWEQALIAEVYTLNAFLMLVCLAALWEYGQTGRRLWLYGLALAVGAGLATHNTVLLLAPLFALYALWCTPFPLQQWRTWLACSAVAACGMLLYLYLPVRSAANPPMDWGNPEDLRRTWAVMTREQFAFMMHAAPRSLPRFILQMQVYFQIWLREFTPWVAILGGVGLVTLTRRRPGFSILLLAVAGMTLAGFSLIQNFGPDKEWVWVMTVFGIPAWAVCALGVAAALVAAGERWGANTAAVLGAVAVFSPFVAHIEHNNRSEDTWTADFARNVLETLPEGAVLVPETDTLSFGAVYLQSVEGRRPDVTLARKYGYVDLDALQGFPADLRNRMGAFPPRRYDPEIVQWILDHSERPVFCERPMPLPGVRWAPAGLVYQALREGEAAAAEEYWAAYTWHTLDPAEARGDYTAEAILMAVHFGRGRDLLAAGLVQEGLREVEIGVAVYGEEVQALNNAGVLLARYGAYTEAAAYFTRALARDPGNATAALNLRKAEARMNARP